MAAGGEIGETTEGVSKNDQTATKPIGEMGPWPKRHDKKQRERRGEMPGVGRGGRDMKTDKQDTQDGWS